MGSGVLTERWVREQTEGVMTRCCEETLRVMRENKQVREHPHAKRTKPTASGMTMHGKRIHSDLVTSDRLHASPALVCSTWPCHALSGTAGIAYRVASLLACHARNGLPCAELS